MHEPMTTHDVLALLKDVKRAADALERSAIANEQTVSLLDTISEQAAELIDLIGSPLIVSGDGAVPL